MLTDWFHVINNCSYCCEKLREMPGNTLKLSGNVREFYFACGNPGFCTAHLCADHTDKTHHVLCATSVAIGHIYAL